jgi:glutaconate CoA-transferase subunit A
LQPDVAALHVQLSDEQGNAHAWGPLGVSREAFLASKRVIITAEEIVPHERLIADPNRVLGLHQKVAAVVHAPGGAHPSPVQDYYGRDHAFFHAYYQASRDAASFRSWLETFVYSPYDRPSACAAMSADRPATAQ